jgi:hypothetical protein
MTNVIIDKDFFNALEKCTIEEDDNSKKKYKIVNNKKEEVKLLIKFDNCQLKWWITNRNTLCLPIIKYYSNSSTKNNTPANINKQIIDIVNKKLKCNILNTSEISCVISDVSIYTSLNSFLKEMNYSNLTNKCIPVYVNIDLCTAEVCISSLTQNDIKEYSVYFDITELGSFIPSTFNKESLEIIDTTIQFITIKQNTKNIDNVIKI